MHTFSYSACAAVKAVVQFHAHHTHCAGRQPDGAGGRELGHCATLLYQSLVRLLTSNTIAKHVHRDCAGFQPDGGNGKELGHSTCVPVAAAAAASAGRHDGAGRVCDLARVADDD